MQKNVANDSISQRIRRLRKSKNLTQEEFAESVGVSRDVIARVETEKSDPSTELISQIAEQHGVSCDYIIRGVQSGASGDFDEESAQTWYREILRKYNITQVDDANGNGLGAEGGTAAGAASPLAAIEHLLSSQEKFIKYLMNHIARLEQYIEAQNSPKA